MAEVKTLRDFSEQKEIMLRAYEDLKVSGHVPVAHGEIKFSVENIDEYIANLNGEKFIVTTCGQIKVGKSTFLNDFIFGAEILPSADAPETAKLTEIVFSEKPYFEAFFYSAEEWERIKNSRFINENGVESAYYDIFIAHVVDKLKSDPGDTFSEDEILAKGSYRGDVFSEIREYVSVGGKFMPFVKYVRIGYPVEILKGIVLVDTPGTNDPNVIRKKITEDWIGKSDAVVFLMYAGQALTSQDIKFIENYLLPVQPEKILVAISKVDAVENVHKPREYVESLFSKHENFKKIIEGGKVYSIAPIFSLYPKLLKKHEKKEIVLTPEKLDEINFQLFDRGVDAEIISKKGFMEEFSKALENHLVKIRGENALRSHIKKIESIFECNVNNLLDERKALEAKIDAIGGSWKEVENETRQLWYIIDRINEAEGEVATRLSVDYAAFSNALNDLFYESINSGVKKDVSEIISKRDIDFLAANLLWEVKNSVDNYLSVLLNKKIIEVVENFKNAVDNIRTYLRKQVMSLNLISDTVFGAAFGAISVDDLFKDSEKYFESSLSEMKLRALIKNDMFSMDVNTSKKMFFDLVNKMLSNEDEFRSVIGKRKSDIMRGIRAKFSYIFEMIDNEIYKKNKILLKIAKTSEKDNLEIEKIKGMMAAVDEKIKAIEAKFRDINPEF